MGRRRRRRKVSWRVPSWPHLGLAVVAAFLGGLLLGMVVGIYQR